MSGGVGPSDVGTGVGRVHFRLCVSISFAFGSQHKHSFQWNMGLSQNVLYAPGFTISGLCDMITKELAKSNDCNMIDHNQNYRIGNSSVCFPVFLEQTHEIQSTAYR